jgi:hypothetical protein
MPWMIQSNGFSIGFFDKYFSGKVQNPAIAAALAILISVFVSLIVHYTSKKKEINPASLKENIS